MRNHRSVCARRAAAAVSASRATVGTGSPVATCRVDASYGARSTSAARTAPAALRAGRLNGRDRVTPGAFVGLVGRSGARSDQPDQTAPTEKHWRVVLACDASFPTPDVRRSR